MTRQAMLYARCRRCDVDGVCPICGEKIHRFSPFSDWLRGLGPPLNSSCVSNQNLDFIWHNHREDWFITMEEKKNGARCSQAQRDTHGIVYQFLQLASEVIKLARGNVVAGIGGKRQRKRVEYRGHYVVSFEKTNPEDSVWILINPGKHSFQTNTEGLLHLLKTGTLPENG